MAFTMKRPHGRENLGKLIKFGPNNENKDDITITESPYYIGSGWDHAVLKHNEIVEHQVKIVKKDDNSLEISNKSTRPMTVAGQVLKTPQSMPLNPGDIITFGTRRDLKYMFTLNGTPLQPRPPKAPRYDDVYQKTVDAYEEQIALYKARVESLKQECDGMRIEWNALNQQNLDQAEENHRLNRVIQEQQEKLDQIDAIIHPE